MKCLHHFDAHDNNWAWRTAKKIEIQNRVLRWSENQVQFQNGRKSLYALCLPQLSIDGEVQQLDTVSKI